MPNTPGVATGTAYVHYASKDELVLAAYSEVKAELGAAIVHIDVTLEPSLRFQAMWRAVYEHLAADAVRARFLLQVDASPYAGAAHSEAMADPEDQLARAASTPDMQEQLTGSASRRALRPRPRARGATGGAGRTAESGPVGSFGRGVLESDQPPVTSGLAQPASA